MRRAVYKLFITDLRMGNKLNAKFADKGIYVNDPLLSEKPTSECMANYVWQVRRLGYAF